MATIRTPSSRENINHLLAAWFCFRNRYFPYIHQSKRGIIVTIVLAALLTIPAITHNISTGQPAEFFGFKWTFMRVLGLLFVVNVAALFLKEITSEGTLFPSQKEIQRIDDRKRITAAKVEESLTFVGSFATVDDVKIAQFRTDVLDLIKSHLESYFCVFSKRKGAFAVSLVEEIETGSVRKYRIVARDGESSKFRTNEELAGDIALLYKPVEAIREKRIATTDDLVRQYRELSGKNYRSVLAIPILWLSRGPSNEVKSECFSAIAVDYSGRYRFRGIEERVETNLRPYYKLLLSSFLGRLIPTTGGETHVPSTV